MVPVPLLLRTLIRRQDLVWLLLFAALAFVSSHPTRQEIGLLLCLGAFQIVESRIDYFNTPRGTVASVLSSSPSASSSLDGRVESVVRIT